MDVRQGVEQSQSLMPPGSARLCNNNAATIIVYVTVPGKNNLPTFENAQVNVNDGFAIDRNGKDLQESNSSYNYYNNDEIVYVNPKQYSRIIKRREARAQLVAEGRITSNSRKPYLHESRHNHAMNRIRSKDGRFKSTAEPDKVTKPSNKKRVLAKKDESAPPVRKILPALSGLRPVVIVTINGKNEVLHAI